MTHPVPSPSLLSRRNTLLTAGAVALGASLSRIPSGALAQSTPVASPAERGGVELSPGVWAEVFAGVPSARAKGQTVYLARFTFYPGSEIFPHNHPGTVLLSVASGTFGWTLVEGTAYVVRGAAAGAADQAQELGEQGADVLLEPGDAIYYEDDVVHTARGAGDTPSIVFGALVLTSDKPLLMPMDGAMMH